jgi:general secretion pathway protein H
MAPPAVTATTPTSVPGSSRRRAHRGERRGFTLIELMIVVALVAVAAGVVSLALRDPAGTRLQTEAQRLIALLESARAESRASGLEVFWVPTAGDSDADFRFLLVSGGKRMPMARPTRWLDPNVRAQVVRAPAVQLGPEPLIAAQRIVLSLADQRVALATDGLGPFAVVDDEAGR